MKKLSLIPLTLLLSSCIFTAKFDSVEYSYVTQIRTVSQLSRSHCDNSSYMRDKAEQLTELSLNLVHYSEHLPNNEPTYNMSKELFSIVEPMHIRYLTSSKVSKIYCEEKLETIMESTEVMQKSMNKRSR